MSALEGLNPGLWSEDTASLRALEQRLLDLWGGRGFAEVVPPLLLPETEALAASSEALSSRTLKLQANGDGPLALRSDFTAGVAWMVSRRYRTLEAPLRVSYSGAVLRRPTPDRPEGLETLQGGCERVSPAAGLEGDEEMLRLAAESLLALGVKDPVLELGHWGLVGPLMDRMAWPAEGRAALESALNRKSSSALTALSGRFGQSSELALLGDLLHLGGRPEAVDALGPRLRTAGVMAVWVRVRELGALLEREFPKLAVRLEPTDVRHWSYYTGLTVKAFVPGHPFAVLSGGRYDGLYPALGRPFGAFGFAVHLGRLLEKEG